MRSALAAIVAAWGCGGAPAPVEAPIAPPRSPTDPIPGLLWATPAQRWRLAEITNTVLLAPGGATVLAGADRGHLDRYDARTGAQLPRIQLPTALPISAIAPIGTSGRFVVVAQSGSGEYRRGRAVFDLTIARGGAGELASPPREIAMPPMPRPRDATDTDFVDGAALALPDGSIVIAGNGLPLAAYDPATWKVKTMFAKDRGWSRLGRGGHFLVAAHDSAEQRFDLDTGAAIPVRGILNQLAADGSIVHTQFRSIDDANPDVGHRIVSVLHPGPGHVEELEVGTVNEVGADPDAPRLVSRDRDTLQIRDLAGKVTATIALPAEIPGLGLEDASWAGDRFAAASASTLLVVDVAAGTASPLGDPPYAPSAITIADDGTITGRDVHVAWDANGGKRLHAVPVEGDADPLPQVPGALLVRRHAQVALVAPADAEPVRATWSLGWRPLSVFAARDGRSIVVESDMNVDHPFDLLRFVRGGAAPVALFQHNWDSTMADLDVDSGDALVQLAGRVGVVRANVPQPFVLRTPDCIDSGGARLEIGGARAATWTKDAIAVWDRTTGGLRGAARLETSIEDVQFVPHREDIVIATRDGLVLWLPNGAGGDVRAVAMPAVDWLAVSPSGKRLGLAFADGRIAALDFDAAFARAPASGNRPARPQIPAQCGSAGVFESAPPPPEPPTTVEPQEDGGCDDCDD